MSSATDFLPHTLAAISLQGRTGGVVKRLRGFRKDRHTVPDAVNGATQAFFARLSADERAEDAEEWFQRARAGFGYKRRELQLESGSANAVLAARDFVFEINWALEDADPSAYMITRTLRDFRALDFIMSDPCTTVFAGTFTDIVFTLTRGVAVEAVIDAVEALPEPAALDVHYPASCAECTLRVADVAAEVRCTGATLELLFPHAGSPKDLIAAFGEVREAFRFTQNEALLALL